MDKVSEILQALDEVASSDNWKNSTLESRKQVIANVYSQINEFQPIPEYETALGSAFEEADKEDISIVHNDNLSLAQFVPEETAKELSIGYKNRQENNGIVDTAVNFIADTLGGKPVNPENILGATLRNSASIQEAEDSLRNLAEKYKSQSQSNPSSRLEPFRPSGGAGPVAVQEAEISSSYFDALKKLEGIKKGFAEKGITDPAKQYQKLTEISNTVGWDADDKEEYRQVGNKIVFNPYKLIVGTAQQEEVLNKINSSSLDEAAKRNAIEEYKQQQNEAVGPILQAFKDRDPNAKDYAVEGLTGAATGLYASSKVSKNPYALGAGTVVGGAASLTDLLQREGFTDFYEQQKQKGQEDKDILRSWIDTKQDSPIALDAAKTFGRVYNNSLFGGLRQIGQTATTTTAAGLASVGADNAAGSVFDISRNLAKTSQDVAKTSSSMGQSSGEKLATDVGSSLAAMAPAILSGRVLPSTAMAQKFSMGYYFSQGFAGAVDDEFENLVQANRKQGKYVDSQQFGEFFRSPEVIANAAGSGLLSIAVSKMFGRGDEALVAGAKRDALELTGAQFAKKYGVDNVRKAFSDKDTFKTLIKDMKLVGTKLSKDFVDEGTEELVQSGGDDLLNYIFDPNSTVTLKDSVKNGINNFVVGGVAGDVAGQVLGAKNERIDRFDTLVKKIDTAIADSKDPDEIKQLQATKEGLRRQEEAVLNNTTPIKPLAEVTPEMDDETLRQIAEQSTEEVNKAFGNFSVAEDEVSILDALEPQQDEQTNRQPDRSTVIDIPRGSVNEPNAETGEQVNAQSAGGDTQRTGIQQTQGIDPNGDQNINNVPSGDVVDNRAAPSVQNEVEANQGTPAISPTEIQTNNQSVGGIVNTNNIPQADGNNVVSPLSQEQVSQDTIGLNTQSEQGSFNAPVGIQESAQTVDTQNQSETTTFAPSYTYKPASELDIPQVESLNNAKANAKKTAEALRIAKNKVKTGTLTNADFATVQSANNEAKNQVADFENELEVAANNLGFTIKKTSQEELPANQLASPAESDAKVTAIKKAKNAESQQKDKAKTSVALQKARELVKKVSKELSVYDGDLDKSQQKVADYAKSLNRTIIWVKGNDKINGFVNASNPDFIYLNVDSKKNIENLFVHEFSHTVEGLMGDRFGEFTKGLQRLFPAKWAAIEKDQSIAKANKNSEFVAEILEEQGISKKLFELAIQNKVTPTAKNRFLKGLKDFVNSVIGKLGNNKDTKELSEVDALIDEYLNEAVKKVAPKKEAKIKDVKRDIKEDTVPSNDARGQNELDAALMRLEELNIKDKELKREMLAASGSIMSLARKRKVTDQQSLSFVIDELSFAKSSEDINDILEQAESDIKKRILFSKEKPQERIAQILGAKFKWVGDQFKSGDFVDLSINFAKEIASELNGTYDIFDKKGAITPQADSLLNDMSAAIRNQMVQDNYAEIFSTDQIRGTLAAALVAEISGGKRKLAKAMLKTLVGEREVVTNAARFLNAQGSLTKRYGSTMQSLIGILIQDKKKSKVVKELVKTSGVDKSTAEKIINDVEEDTITEVVAEEAGTQEFAQEVEQAVAQDSSLYISRLKGLMDDIKSSVSSKLEQNQDYLEKLREALIKAKIASQGGNILYSARDIKPIEEMTAQELVEEMNKNLLAKVIPDEIFNELREINKQLLQEVANDADATPEKKKIARGMARILEEGVEKTSEVATVLEGAFRGRSIKNLKYGAKFAEFIQSTDVKSDEKSIAEIKSIFEDNISTAQAKVVLDQIVDPVRKRDAKRKAKEKATSVLQQAIQIAEKSIERKAIADGKKGEPMDLKKYMFFLSRSPDVSKEKAVAEIEKILEAFPNDNLEATPEQLFDILNKAAQAYQKDKKPKASKEVESVPKKEKKTDLEVAIEAAEKFIAKDGDDENPRKKQRKKENFSKIVNDFLNSKPNEITDLEGDLIRKLNLPQNLAEQVAIRATQKKVDAIIRKSSGGASANLTIEHLIAFDADQISEQIQTLYPDSDAVEVSQTSRTLAAALKQVKAADGLAALKSEILKDDPTISQKDLVDQLETFAEENGLSSEDARNVALGRLANIQKTLTSDIVASMVAESEKYSTPEARRNAYEQKLVDVFGFSKSDAIEYLDRVRAIGSKTKPTTMFDKLEKHVQAKFDARYDRIRDRIKKLRKEYKDDEKALEALQRIEDSIDDGTGANIIDQMLALVSGIGGYVTTQDMIDIELLSARLVKTPFNKEKAVIEDKINKIIAKYEDSGLVESIIEVQANTFIQNIFSGWTGLALNFASAVVNTGFTLVQLTFEGARSPKNTFDVVMASYKASVNSGLASARVYALDGVKSMKTGVENDSINASNTLQNGRLSDGDILIQKIERIKQARRKAIENGESEVVIKGLKVAEASLTSQAYLSRTIGVFDLTYREMMGEFLSRTETLRKLKNDSVASRMLIEKIRYYNSPKGEAEIKEDPTWIEYLKSNEIYQKGATTLDVVKSRNDAIVFHELRKQMLEASLVGIGGLNELTIAEVTARAAELVADDMGAETAEKVPTLTLITASAFYKGLSKAQSGLKAAGKFVDNQQSKTMRVALGVPLALVSPVVNGIVFAGIGTTRTTANIINRMLYMVPIYGQLRYQSQKILGSFEKDSLYERRIKAVVNSSSALGLIYMAILAMQDKEDPWFIPIPSFPVDDKDRALKAKYNVRDGKNAFVLKFGNRSTTLAGDRSLGLFIGGMADFAHAFNRLIDPKDTTPKKDLALNAAWGFLGQTNKLVERAISISEKDSRTGQAFFNEFIIKPSLSGWVNSIPVLPTKFVAQPIKEFGYTGDERNALYISYNPFGYIQSIPAIFNGSDEYALNAFGNKLDTRSWFEKGTNIVLPATVLDRRSDFEKTASDAGYSPRYVNRDELKKAIAKRKLEDDDRSEEVFLPNDAQYRVTQLVGKMTSETQRREVIVKAKEFIAKGQKDKAKKVYADFIQSRKKEAYDQYIKNPDLNTLNEKAFKSGGI